MTKLSQEFIEDLNKIPIERWHELFLSVEVPRKSDRSKQPCKVCEGTLMEFQKIVRKEMKRQGWE